MNNDLFINKQNKDEYIYFVLNRRKEYNKEHEYNNKIVNFLNKISEIFEWKNLPQNIESRILEKNLMLHGNLIFTKINNDYYFFWGNKGSVRDEFYEYKAYLVANPWAKISREFLIGEDCILIKNNTFEQSVLDVIESKINILNELELTFHTIGKYQRNNMILVANDNRTAESASEYLKNLEKGKVTIIKENNVIGETKAFSTQGNNSNITQLLELYQYIKSDLFSSFGVNINSNMKREYVNNEELEISFSHIVLLINNMLEVRKEAVEKINNMYNLNIEVNYKGMFKKLYDDLMTTNIINKEEQTEKEVVNGSEEDDKANIQDE